MMSRRRAIRSAARDPVRKTAHRADMLLVGMENVEARALPTQLFGALAQDTVSVRFDALDSDTIGEAMAILSPVVGRDFDAVDVAERLHAAGYEGRYIAYAAEIAHEGLIRREVAQVAPGIAFNIVTLGFGPRLAV